MPGMQTIVQMVSPSFRPLDKINCPEHASPIELHGPGKDPEGTTCGAAPCESGLG